MGLLKLKTMKEPKFKVDEWCFFEFNLFQVKETEEDRITCVSDGNFSHSGLDLSDRCFPIDMKVKIASDETESWYQSIRKEAGNSNINYPQIHGHLVGLWIKLCVNRDNENTQKKYWDKLQIFGNNLVQKLRDMRLEEVEGIPIIRP